jgi:hypothetical protein
VRDIVIMPAYFRPEYTALALEYLAAADGAKDKEVWVEQDRAFQNAGYLTQELPLMRQVVNAHALGHSFAKLEYRERTPNPYMGNPCNFLEAYKRAYEQTDVRYVYLVEDDVLVSKDFFRWHEAVQATDDFFVTVGWHCVRNPEVKPSTDPTEYITSYRDYSSIGVCWQREKLAPLVKHATPVYYQAMAPYLGRAFPGSPIPAGQWTEQAGVVTRLLHETPGKRLVAWPSLRRCSHVGVAGYHRPNGHKFTGNLGQRIEDLKTAVSSASIQRMSRDFVDDIEPVTVPGDWEPSQLHRVQHVPYVNGKI